MFCCVIPLAQFRAKMNIKNKGDFMFIKKYRVRLIADDLLKAINAIECHKDISANSIESAWRKFIVKRMAPVFRFQGSGEYVSFPWDYDIRLEIY